MTLVDQLKQLESGDRRSVVNPEEVPCRETSDAERLCKHPVVSVVMVTYNHEPYIRQAVESVLCQKSDFEYELIIGEDCSTDKTREICFEYQKRFPEKVRVLWADRNLYQLGISNERRCIDHCRGEYIAFCEGDDYWTDPLKLQKQVNLISRTKSVACVAFTKWKYPDGHEVISDYARKDCLDISDLSSHYFHTTTHVFDRKVFLDAVRKYEIGRLLSMTLLYAMRCSGRVCLLSDVVSVYRITGSGVASSLSQWNSNFLSLRSSLQIIDSRMSVELIRRERVSALFAIRMIYSYRDSGRYLNGRRWPLIKLYLNVLFIRPFDYQEIFGPHFVKFLCAQLIGIMRFVPWIDKKGKMSNLRAMYKG